MEDNELSAQCLVLGQSSVSGVHSTQVIGISGTRKTAAIEYNLMASGEGEMFSSEV